MRLPIPVHWLPDSPIPIRLERGYPQPEPLVDRAVPGGASIVLGGRRRMATRLGLLAPGVSTKLLMLSPADDSPTAGNDGLLGLSKSDRPNRVVVNQVAPVTTTLAFDGVRDVVNIGDIGARPPQGALSFWMNSASVDNNRNVLTTGPLASSGPAGNGAIRFEQSSSGACGGYRQRRRNDLRRSVSSRRALPAERGYISRWSGMLLPGACRAISMANSPSTTLTGPGQTSSAISISVSVIPTSTTGQAVISSVNWLKCSTGT